MYRNNNTTFHGARKISLFLRKQTLEASQGNGQMVTALTFYS